MSAIIYDIIEKPWITEKATHFATRSKEGVHGGQYTFKVRTSASKGEIKAAIEKLYNVKVLSVNTQTRKGKSRRMGMRYGVTSDFKKAIVTLDPKDTIQFL